MLFSLSVKRNTQKLPKYFTKNTKVMKYITNDSVIAGNTGVMSEAVISAKVARGNFRVIAKFVR